MPSLRELVVGRLRVERALCWGMLAVWGVGSACTTNHDALALQPKGGAASGGSGGRAAVGGGGFGNTGDVPSSGGRPNPDYEPAGDSVLTIVNGVVDAPSVRLCFARADVDAQTSELVAEPGAELGYGAATVVSELTELSFADDAIEPWLVAGQLGLIDGLDCRDAVALAVDEEARVTPECDETGAAGAASAAGAAGQAGAAAAGPALELPRLRARPLAVIPAGSLSQGRSVLMVMSGCLGGAAYSDAIDTAVCGDDYAPSSPTLQPIVVNLSRAIGFDKVALQAVQGSLASGSIDMRAAGDNGTTSLTFASSLVFGAIEPRPADERFGTLELGIGQRTSGLQAASDQGVILKEDWSTVLERSGLSSVDSGRGYTAILVGPSPLVAKKGFWNPAAFVLVDNDPTRAP